MNSIFGELVELSGISIAFRIFLAALIGGFIGLERSKHGRAAGLRTHLLVCISAALTAMVGVYAGTLSAGADTTRIASGVMSGLGFLCAGSILVKNRDVVYGLTTAATVWVTASIGIAIGFGFYEAAILTGVVTIISVEFLNILEIEKKEQIRFYLEIDDAKKVNEVLDKLRDLDIHLTFSYVGAPKTGIAGNVGIYIVTNLKVSEQDLLKINVIIEKMLKLNHVVFAIKEQ